MSDGPSLLDQLNQRNAFAGAVGGKKAEDKTNDGLGVSDPGKPFYNLAKTVGLPVNLSAALNHGGMQQGLESEGLLGKNIPSLMGSLNVNGGPAASLLHSIFIKNLLANIGPMQWAEAFTYNTGVDVSPADYGNLPIQPMAYSGGPDVSGPSFHHA